MQQQINDLITKVDYLEKLINTVQQNINFNIAIFIALLTLTAAIIGFALKILAKAWVEKKVENELIALRKEHNDFIAKTEAKYNELFEKSKELERQQTDDRFRNLMGI